nr:Type 1 glutamine amidotransferase-like domain-containing protein [Evansella caseinilytica]
MNYSEVTSILEESTGIFIGGGDTEKYHHYYANEPIKSLIKEKYNRGIPIGGSSAGALILPEISLISPNDTKNGEMISKDGIGLLNDILIGVHFTEWNKEKNLVAGMLKHKIAHGIGIDEEACAVFRNGQFENAYGEAVHHLRLTDIAEGKYEKISD